MRAPLGTGVPDAGDYVRAMRQMRPHTKDTREAWRRYVSTGALLDESLREPVFRAWERCHDLGTSPLQPQAEQLSPEATERLVAERAELVDAARPYMAALSRAAGQDRHAAMLGDERGVVLDIVGDEATVHGPEPFPGPGALLAEEVSGANGIGTPLAGGEYVELVGPEHFIGGFHVFTCQGTPVRAPDGSVAGVISTSVRRVEASARLREILVCAAHGIEAELLRGRLEQDVRRVVADPSTRALERLRDDVMQSYASARIRLEAAARKVTQRGPGAALALIGEAQRAMDRFQRTAILWRELASAEVGRRRAVAVEELAADLIELLQTEARIRGVELRAGALEPVTATADARSLARLAFGAILDGLAGAGPGGSVLVETRPRAGVNPPLLSISVEPELGGTKLERAIPVAGDA